LADGTQLKLTVTNQDDDAAILVWLDAA